MKLSVKLTGIAAAFAFALTVASPVSAQTVADLQAMIAQLQAQLTALSGTSSATSTTTFTYTRDLTLGSTGSDVVALQTFLESKGQLTMPAGVAKGYFGEVTRAALARYQANHMITPAVGYFGPATRAKVMAEGAITTPGTGTPSTPGSLSGGEASLEAFDIEGEDDAEEGEMEHVATVEFDVEDGDAQINRLDVSFVSGSATNEENEPWDAFDTITLMIDGDEVAEEDMNDEDDWLRDNEPFVFRLSNIDYVVEEGETVEIEIWLTTQNSVDGADTNGNARWDIAVDTDAIRAVDSQGIQNYIGGSATYAVNGYTAGDFVTFDIVEAGDGEDLTIKSSSDDIDAATLLVDDEDDSEWHDVFVFNIEGEENDIDLEDLKLTVTTTGSNYDVVVEDAMITIDGEEFDDFAVADAASLTADLTFDIDGDFTIDADDTVEVVVSLMFKDTADQVAYQNGDTVKVETVFLTGEGVDDITETKTVTGSTHTLSTSAPELTNVSWSTSETDTTGVIDFFFTISAEEGDVDVLAADILDDATGTAFTNTAGTPETSALGILSRISGDSVTAIGATGFTVNEGDETRFRVRYQAAGAGSYEVNIESVAGIELADDKQLSPTVLLEA